MEFQNVIIAFFGVRTSSMHIIEFSSDMFPQFSHLFNHELSCIHICFLFCCRETEAIPKRKYRRGGLLKKYERADRPGIYVCPWEGCTFTSR